MKDQEGSGRQRESHHLLHLSGTSTNTSHQFFSGQDLSSEHDIHAPSPKRTEQRRGPRGRGGKRRMHAAASASSKCHRILAEEIVGLRPQHLLKTTRENSDPHQIFSYACPTTTLPSSQPCPLAHIPLSHF